MKAYDKYDLDGMNAEQTIDAIKDGDITKEEFLEWLENVDDTNFETEKSDYKSYILEKI